MASGQPGCHQRTPARRVRPQDSVRCMTCRRSGLRTDRARQACTGVLQSAQRIVHAAAWRSPRTLRSQSRRGHAPVRCLDRHANTPRRGE
jgi:hypothetical protein